MDKKHRKTTNKYQVLTLLFGVVFLCCVVWLAAYFIGQRRAEAEMEDIRDSYVSETDSEVAEGEISKMITEKGDPEGNIEVNGKDNQEETTVSVSENVEVPAETEERQELSDYGVADKLVDIATLQREVNPDIYAWITVPGTVIDYPVLQHPEEMDYYLDYNLDGTKGYPGCIYTQRMNSKDWTDPNTVLYGHNMKAGTMFAGLHKFKDKEFFDENRYIHIYTEDGRILVYEIFAAYVSGNEHLLMTYMIQTEDGFQSYLDGICEHTGSGCHFLEDRELTAEDRIITLSTCISGQEMKRYLVQGVFVDEIEINN